METVFIALSNGGFAIVDADDVDIVAGRRWYSVESRGTRYAKTGKNSRMHRMILGVSDPTIVVDHINGDGLDNRRSNLRQVDVTANVQNRQRSKSGGRCPGVYREGSKWRAQVTVNYTKHNLGFFELEDDAIKAVNSFRESIGRPMVSVDFGARA